jgi:hypothetical protein
VSTAPASFKKVWRSISGFCGCSDCDDAYNAVLEIGELFCVENIPKPDAREMELMQTMQRSNIVFVIRADRSVVYLHRRCNSICLSVFLLSTAEKKLVEWLDAVSSGW